MVAGAPTPINGVGCTCLYLPCGLFAVPLTQVFSGASMPFLKKTRKTMEAENIENNLNLINIRVESFKNCLAYLGHEEDTTNNSEVKDACLCILRHHVEQIHKKFDEIRKSVLHSIVDDRSNEISQININLDKALSVFEGYADKAERTSIYLLRSKMNDGKCGFRTSKLCEDYYKNLFFMYHENSKETSRDTLEQIYMTDYEEEKKLHADDNLAKRYMLRLRKDNLFNSMLGKVYHDVNRDAARFMCEVIDKKQRKEDEIIGFMKNLVDVEIAKAHLELQEESVVKNVAFKDAVNVDKVMQQLNKYIEDKTLNAQKHWYIVYKVFSTKKWLSKETQTKFREQINASFRQELKCSNDDFKKVDSYFKNTKYADWDPENPQAPQCCAEYKNIAMKLDTEFISEKYAKSNCRINGASKIEKFR